MQKIVIILAIISILIIGLAQRLRLIFSDTPTLIQYVADDGFYYLVTAENIVAGNGSTFDGVNLTNGYHPLFMGVAIIVAMLTDGEMYLQVILIVNTLILTLAITLLALYLWYKIRAVWLVILMAAIVYWHPMMLAASLNGLETSVLILTLVFVLWAMEQDNPIIFGAALGLLCLARTDQIVIAGLVGLVYVWHYRENWFMVGLKISLAFFVIVSPWLFYTLTTFGELLQVSGSAIPYRHNVVLSQQYPDVLEQLMARNSTAVRLLGFLPIDLALSTIGAVVMLIAFCGGVWQARSHLHQYPGFLAIGVGFIILFIIHGGIRLSIQRWYFAHTLIWLAVIAALLLAPLWVKYARWFAISGVALLLYILIGGSFHKPYPWQIETLQAAYWLRDNAATDAIVASWNAGIIGFYSEHPTVNLDGVINNAAYEALRSHQLTSFIHNNDVTYIADYAVSFSFYEDFMGEPLLVTPVERIDLPDVEWSGSYMVIVTVD